MLDHQVGKVLLRIMFHALIAERLSPGSWEFDTFSSSSCHPGGRHRWWPLLQALFAAGYSVAHVQQVQERNRC
jgi:hypothetical protein